MLLPWPDDPACASARRLAASHHASDLIIICNNVAALVVSSIPLAYNEDWVRILHFEVYILKSTWNKDVRELEEEVT